MAWVVVERGEELERCSTYHRNELLCWTFPTVTFSMAADYEVAHRVNDEDSCRLLSSHQSALLRTLDPRWETRRPRELGPLLDEVGLS